jgi:hypothetical protein
MHAFGMLLLAAATAGDGFGYNEADVGHKKWLRSHLVSSTHATGAPPYNAASMAGAGGMNANNGRRFIVTKSQLYFLDPNGMQIGWQNGTGPSGDRTYLPAQLTVPARYNFNQGFIYRLKINNIPGRSTAISLYPTLEVAPTTPATDAYLAHNAIPVQFTSEDFDQVIDGGNFVTKVIYLPDPKYQELAISGVETLVSTRLEPGVDPILEADKRGTILLIVRLGAIDLESPNLQGAGSPIMGSSVSGPIVNGGMINGGIVNGGIVNGGMINGGMVNGGTVIGAPIMNANPADLAPGTLPPGLAVPAAPAPGNVILDPATPATAAPPPAAPAPGVTTAPAPIPVTPAPPPAAPAPGLAPPPPPPGQ